MDLPIRLADAEDFDWFARLMESNDPWRVYGCTYPYLRQRLDWHGSWLFVAGDRAGGMLAHERGFLGSPYIATLLVAPGQRNQGVGTQLLRHAEQAFRGQRQMFICASAFNQGAQRLYMRYGFEQVGVLPDLVADGFNEVLLRKRLQPRP